jgi:hypothetical protein
MSAASEFALQPIDTSPTDFDGWQVYRLNDCEWWLARSLEEAKKDAAECWGFTLEEAEEEDLFDDPHALDAHALDTLTFVDHFEDTPVRRTFREELALRVSEGKQKGDLAPQLFATTEW